MKLTKKLEAEILKVYYGYWDAYLKGDMKTFASMLDDDITIFGTALSEVFNNKKEALKFYKATADQLTGKVQFRNRKISLNEVDNNILVNEQCDLYLLIDKKWTFYGQVRVSGILKKTKAGWKLLHQHASFPDMRAEKGEQVAAEKIKKENIQLREAVKRRTIELEEKNRELEIESAVERVRAKALAMQSSEDIHEVVSTLRKELFGLGLEGIIGATICLKQDDGRVRLWDITDVKDTGRYSWDILFDIDEIDSRLWVKKIWNSKKKIIAVEQDSNDLKRTLKWLSRYNKKTADEITKLLKVNKIRHGWHRAVKLTNGRLITDFINQPPPGIESILLKIGVAFDLAYQRFLDLKKAEAQSAEAQIELGLERVRARAMAMQNSDELKELIGTVFTELTKLDLVLTRCVIMIYDGQEDSSRWWMANSEDPNNPAGFFIKQHDHPPMVAYFKAWRERKLKYTYPLQGKIKQDWDDFLFSETELKNLPDFVIEGMKAPDLVYLNASFNNFGNLTLASLESLSDEHFDILLRFAKVFDLTYTRFNDLKQAEAQARESQIQLALERVRARTMAMHKSEELLDIIIVVSEQLQQLNIKFSNVSFGINNPEYDLQLCMAVKDHPKAYKIQWSFIDNPGVTRLKKAQQHPEKVFADVLTQKENNEWLNHIFKCNPSLDIFSKENKKRLLKTPGYARSMAIMKDIFLVMGNYAVVPYTDEENVILKRFANVFEQSYTRFLDLQKAEAQTREAQIEASLERVRARTMAMHKSSDLLDVVKILGEQFELLGFKFHSVNFDTDSQEKDLNIWLYNVGSAMYPGKMHIPYIDHPFFNQPIEAYKKGGDLHTFLFTKEEKDSLFDHFYTNTVAKHGSEERKKFTYAAPGFAMSIAVTKNTRVTLANYNAKPFSDDENAILRRFANVFEQSYTRFLDLQKAEAQTREAQIEASLERVRAKTMAMHKSSDLLEVVKILGEQFKFLGFKFDSVNFNTDYKQKDYNLWLYNSESAMYPGMIHIPYIDHPCFNRVLEAFEKGVDFASFIFTKEEKDSFFKHIYTNSVAKYGSEERKRYTYGEPGMAMSVAVTKNISVTITNYKAEPFSEDENAILRRFANVFEQSYTRFLDLQKAEAQAKEAQIEAALERVRARTMGMHESKELHSVIKEVYDQLRHLQFRFDGVDFLTDYSEKGFNLWLAAQQHSFSEPIYVPALDNKIFRLLKDVHKEGKDFFTFHLEHEEKDEYFRHLFDNTIVKNIPEEVKQRSRDAKGMATSCVVLKNIILSASNLDSIPYTDEENEIIKRFAKVFEQSYTRFLDLQKAEAQAREGQIETALERVRARTMGMQRSDELPQAANLLFQQIQSLGMPAWSAGYCTWDDNDKKSLTAWMSSEGVLQPPFKAPTTEDELFIQMRKGAEQGKSLHVVEMGGKELVAHYEYMRTLPVMDEILDSIIEAGHPLPVFQIMHQAYFSKGFLLFITYEPVPEAHDIFRRFAKVFDQTYTRFLDLQKAEAQAREAKIEAALERVRSRSMAMQKSDELAEVVAVLYKQFEELDFGLYQVLVSIYDKKNNVIEWWSKDASGIALPQRNLIPIIDHPFNNDLFEKWESGIEYYPHILEGDIKKSWDEYLFTQTDLKNFPEEVKNTMRSFEKVYLSDVFMKYGSLQAAGPAPLPDDKANILKRFVKVLDQAYTRMTDLQNAEAQAKEAKIEAALERIRSRSMAMHSPEELKDVALELRNQLGLLEQPELEVCAIQLYEESPDYFEAWGAVRPPGDEGKIIQVQVRFPKKGIKILDEMFQQYESGAKDYVLVNEGDKVPEWLNVLKECVPEGYEMVIQSLKGRRPEDTRAYWSMADFKGGSLVMTTYVPPSDDARKLLRRFANVFGLAYRRFIDLKYAETQKREAQIETALERVRAVAMAMRKPEELMQISEVIYKQLTGLGFVNIRNVQIAIDDDAKGTYNGVEYSEYYQNRFNQVPYDTSPIFREIVNEIKRSSSAFYQKEITGKEFEDWRSWRASVKEEEDKGVHPGVATATSMCFYLHSVGTGMLGISTFNQISDEQLDILKRFKNVFELSYRRYIDIEKAETQAREAQIELALERVRARTMAMHQSEELAETAQVLFQQLNELGGAPDRISIGVADEAAGIVNFWTTDQTGSHIDKSFKARLNERTVISKTYQAWKENKRSLVIDLHGDGLKEWIRFAREEMGIVVNADQIRDRRVHHLAFFSHGWILVTTHEPQSTETIQILERFTSVFNLTYRRFLDLQKAEAQAREAQVESALEKVRSRSLAMHKSDELQEVVNTVFERLQELNIEMDSCNIAIFKEGTRDYDYWIASNFQKRSASFHMPYVDLSLTRDLVAAKEGGNDFSTTAYSFEEKNAWFDYAFKNTDFKFLSEERKQFIYNAPAIMVAIAFSKHTGVQVNRYSSELLSEEEAEILKRFSKVFEQAYIRFLDLQRAEAQAREAQIETSLERVRSKTMAMHNSQDVGETVATMFDELVKLGVETVRCGIAIIDEAKTMEVWTASSKEDGSVKLIIGQLDMRNHPLFMQVYNAWKNKELVTTYELIGDDLKNYFRNINNSPNYPIRYDMDSLPYKQSNTAFMFPEGSLFVFSQEPLVTETVQIFKRFAGLFGQTYRRYLDLQRAEAQAREAQIEAALERVRAKAMAMHKSEDLNAAVATVFEELDKLDLGVLRCGISILDKEKRTGDIWVTSITDQGSAVHVSGDESFDIHPLLQGAFEAWLKREDFSYLLEGDDLTEYYKAVKDANFQLPESQTEFKRQYCYTTTYGAGGLFAFRETEFPEEAKTVMRRFAGVFDLTYKRFLDLQKAEANAREAQIEAGLERVRARTMAMHNSEDVSMATATMFTELEKLGIENLRGGITIIKPDQTQEVWSITNLPDGRIIRAIGVFDMRLHPLWRALFKAKENKEDYDYYWLAGKDKEDYITILNATPNYLAQPIKEIPDVHVQSYFFGEGGVWTNSLHPHSEEDKQTMKRFASVFSLTFRRYQDLKKAEAQTREAVIEAALEKVRGKAMAMHNSNDLSATTSIIISELRKLGIKPIRCGVGIISKETHKAQLYTARLSAEGDSLSVVGWVLLEGHPVLENIYEKWITGEDYFPELIGDSLRSYYEQLLAGLSVPLPDFKDEQKHYGHFFSVSVGCLYAWSDVPYSEDEVRILKRFATIIDLTFRRYFELQKSEANAREAVKQAALDRIRADIASMRTITDLDRITPLIWNELTILGIPFIRCGVFIMDETQQLIHTFLSTPDGKAIGAFHLPYETPGNLQHVVSNWKTKSIYTDHWNETEFHQFGEILVKQGALDSAENYLKTIPKGGFYLHFLPFLQGMLYVGNTSQLGNEEIGLIQHVADAFSTAYARYEDFNRLEAAKQQVEYALNNLKQAQQQLVQSEKMASLGELTAGIAHEIQNPLNFVNNFSDVSNELLQEMMEELEKGNVQLAKEIVEDVKQNLEKINHHGKRADGIVKGMLQHSRTSSGQKEMTDINLLTDEYLRLAFHGLRAKDKSFNAKFETEFDNSIEKINIIPQDIGRVVLNLINNAFYAVSEKKKQNSNGYEPTVVVKTKKENGKIEISVRDNGNGISQKVLDKIFQPFFTTKPTGQGTGLGLSLAYDIVTKGHGGELKVETKEGEGSAFIIQLPLN